MGRLLQAVSDTIASMVRQVFIDFLLFNSIAVEIVAGILLTGRTGSRQTCDQSIGGLDSFILLSM